MIASSQEYEKAKEELAELELRLARLHESNPLPASGQAKASLRKMIVRLHEKLGVFEGGREIVIPALPEKEEFGINKVSGGAEPSSPASEIPPRLSDVYENEVLVFVRQQLRDGLSEAEIVANLRDHDFTDNEARSVVREIARELPRSSTRRIGRRNNRVELLTDTYPPSIALPNATPAVDAVDAAQRQMAFGALWFVGGLAVTAFTMCAGGGQGGVIFWGAVLWGAAQFIRGQTNYTAAKAIQDRLYPEERNDK